MKSIILFFLSMFLVPTFANAYDVVVRNPDGVSFYVVSSNPPTKMEGLVKKMRAQKVAKSNTVAFVATAEAADIGPFTTTVVGSRAYVVYYRGTRTGTFKVYRNNDLIGGVFQPMTPGQIVNAYTSENGTKFNWECNLDAFDQGTIYIRIVKTQ